MSDASATASRDSRWRYWLIGARPHTLRILLAPLVIGLCHAWRLSDRIAVIPVLAALFSALMIQVATNLANDAADGDTGLDGPGRLGPQRITGSGLMSSSDMRLGALLATLAAAIAGLICIWYGGWPILVAGIASLAAGWAYSFGPLPISRTPLGEVFVIVFFGIVATTGMVWLASGRVDGLSVWLGLAAGCPAAAVLTVNNHRDRHKDGLAGRRTLAILLGEAWTHRLYAVLLLLGPVIATLALVQDGTPAVLALPIISLPGAVWLSRRFARTAISAGLNAYLGYTAQFGLVLAILISAVLLVRP